MTKERMVELLEIEHECMLRASHDDCVRNCADCDIVQDDDELHEMYTNVIELVKKQIVKMAICGNCGLEHPSDDLKCPRCGEPNMDA